MSEGASYSSVLFLWRSNSAPAVRRCFFWYSTSNLHVTRERLDYNIIMLSIYSSPSADKNELTNVAARLEFLSNFAFDCFSSRSMTMMMDNFTWRLSSAEKALDYISINHSPVLRSLLDERDSRTERCRLADRFRDRRFQRVWFNQKKKHLCFFFSSPTMLPW